MKKLIAIILVLLIIFLGIYIYKKDKTKNNVNITEIQNIEEYISKIYMWSEITEEALPKFDNINEAKDIWIWEVVKKNLDKYEVTKQEIEEKAIELFGSEFEKQFPKEGTEYIYYNEQIKKYTTNGIGLDEEDDSYFIKKINKRNNGYEVEIVEYIEDYGNATYGEDINETYDIYIKNLDHDIIATISSEESEIRAIEVVKENIDQFSTKTIYLKKVNGNIYVESVK